MNEQERADLNRERTKRSERLAEVLAAQPERRALWESVARVTARRGDLYRRLAALVLLLALLGSGCVAGAAREHAEALFTHCDALERASEPSAKYLELSIREYLAAHPDAKPAEGEKHAREVWAREFRRALDESGHLVDVLGGERRWAK